MVKFSKAVVVSADEKPQRGFDCEAVQVNKYSKKRENVAKIAESEHSDYHRRERSSWFAKLAGGVVPAIALSRDD